jgi:hypothetical protein
MTKRQRKPHKDDAVSRQTIGSPPSIFQDLFPPALLSDIRLLIDGARVRAAAAVNSEMVTLYWSVKGFVKTFLRPNAPLTASKLSTR